MAPSRRQMEPWVMKVRIRSWGPDVLHHSWQTGIYLRVDLLEWRPAFLYMSECCCVCVVILQFVSEFDHTINNLKRLKRMQEIKTNR